MILVSLIGLLLANSAHFHVFIIFSEFDLENISLLFTPVYLTHAVDPRAQHVFGGSCNEKSWSLQAGVCWEDEEAAQLQSHCGGCCEGS